MIQKPSEFEVMKVLHALFNEGILTWTQVEDILIRSNQLEVTFLDKDRLEVESLDGLSKYKI